MEQAIWSLQQQSRSLQARRADARGVWNDQASKMIEQRFLRPQLDADEELRAQLEVQNQQASSCQATVDSAQEIGNQAVQTSAECADAVAESSKAMQTAYLYMEHARAAEVRAAGYIQSTLNAISSANAGCGGVSRDPSGPGSLSQVSYAPASVSSSAAGTSQVLRGMGLEEVELSELDFSDNPIEGEFGRADAGREDYEFAVRTWQDVIRPGIANGKGLDDFEAQDRATGASAPRSVAEVYRYFTGGPGSSIHASRRPDGSLQLIDGRHRIATARALGINRLPVFID